MLISKEEYFISMCIYTSCGFAAEYPDDFVNMIQRTSYG